MLDSQKKDFADILNSVMPIFNFEINNAVISVWWSLLQGYELADISAAFSDYLRHGKFAPKPADIIEIISTMKPDGRPGADEAWAMIPRDEYTSVVMTEEMAEAMGIAQPLLEEGDQVAARMAFKEAYSRIVETNKRTGIKPKWFPSLGSDKEGRESVLSEAVRLGRIGSDHAAKLLPPKNDAGGLVCNIPMDSLRSEK